MATLKKFGFPQAAERLGLTLVPYASIKGSASKRRSVFRISQGEKELFTLGATLLSTSFIGMKIAADKMTTNEILRQHGVPTTEQLLVENEDDLKDFYLKHHGDILLKPLNSTLGKGVHGTLRTLEEASIAFHTIQEGFQYVLAEKKIHGKEYRVLVFEDHLIAIAEFVPPTLVGNGQDSILGLIEKHNATVAAHGKTYLIPIKPELVHILAEQNLTLAMVPPASLSIPLYRTAPISHGGKTVDVTDLVHPSNKALFLKAAQAISLNVAGIDVITEDISKPLEETGGVIIEINGGPDLSLHYQPENRPGFDPAETILRLYFGIK